MNALWITLGLMVLLLSLLHMSWGCRKCNYVRHGSFWQFLWSSYMERCPGCGDHIVFGEPKE